MPRKQRKFRPDEIVVAHTAFVTSCMPEHGPYSVAVGDRLRGDHEVVKRCGVFFAPDGTPTDELGRLRARAAQDAEAKS
jgi:hypothetical protein